jgi:hypothetical protein
MSSHYVAYGESVALTFPTQKGISVGPFLVILNFIGLPPGAESTAIEPVNSARSVQPSGTATNGRIVLRGTSFANKKNNE